MAKKVTTLQGLTKKEQKVAIARDIIAAVKSELYIASTDRYVGTAIGVDGDTILSRNCWQDRVDEEFSGKDVKEEWSKIKTCEVCAVGACLMSITKYKNKLKFNDLPQKNGFKDVHLELLQSVFTPKELALMEYMFEGGSDMLIPVGVGHLKAKVSNKKMEICDEFADKYPDENKRLIAIMNNIIKNGTIKL